MDTIWLASGKSGGGPPQSKTLPRRTVTRVNAKRLGLLQPSGALTKCAYVNTNCYRKRKLNLKNETGNRQPAGENLAAKKRRRHKTNKK
jgi:hypothetical protein